MLSGDGVKSSGSRRESRSARFAACSREMAKSRLTTDLTSGGMPVRESIDRRCVRLSLACCCCKEWADHPERPLIVSTLPSEVPGLGGRGKWARLGGPITASSKITGMMDCSRTWGGDGGGTVSRLDVDE